MDQINGLFLKSFIFITKTSMIHHNISLYYVHHQQNVKLKDTLYCLEFLGMVLSHFVLYRVICDVIYEPLKSIII